MKRPFPFVTLSFKTLLVALLAVDCAFITANLLAAIAVNAALIDHVPLWLKITEDREPPEDFNYLKWLVILAALLWMAIRDRWLAPALWALVFAMIFSDDAFQLHENLGEWVSTSLSISDGAFLYGRDVGEMLVFGTMGLITLAIVFFLFTRPDAPTRQMSWRYLVIVLCLGTVGVAVDAIHSVLSHLTGGDLFGTLTRQALGMIEDGGEMLVGSFAVALTLAGVPAVSAHSTADRLDDSPDRQTL